MLSRTTGKVMSHVLRFSTISTMTESSSTMLRVITRSPSFARVNYCQCTKCSPRWYVVQNNLTVSQHGRMFLYHYQFYLCLINYQPIQKQLSSWVRVDWTKCNIALCSKKQNRKNKQSSRDSAARIKCWGPQPSNLFKFEQRKMSA